MKIEYRTGNLFLDPEMTHVVHCCNAQGRMASGFAKDLRARFPGAYDAYMDAYESKGLRLGQIIPYRDDKITIYNLIGQEFYGKDGRRYVSYDALAEGFARLDEFAYFDKLFMPLLGAVLAGGKWSIISSIIEEHSKNYSPIVYLFDGKMPE